MVVDVQRPVAGWTTRLATADDDIAAGRVARSRHGRIHVADFFQSDGSVAVLCGNLVIQPYRGALAGVPCPTCLAPLSRRGDAVKAGA